MYVHHAPYFRPTWFSAREVGIPEWLTDGRWVPPGEFGLYTHARTGLAAALSDRGVGDGVALVPSYAPPSVVGLLHREFGLRVEYFPVRGDLTVPTDAAVDLIRRREPAVVVLIHYLGFETGDVDDVAAAADAVGAVLVEDCARGLFSRRADGSLLGSVGDVATFSLRKTLPVPNGGLVVAPGTRLPSPDAEAREASALVRSLFVAAQERLDSPAPSIPLRKPIAATTKHATALWQLTSTSRTGAGPGPASRADSTADHRVPARRPGRVSRLGLLRCRPAEIVAARRARYRDLRERLESLDCLSVLTPPLADGTCPYGVGVRPLGAVSADALWTALRERGLPAEMLGWALGPDVPRPDCLGAAALRRSLLVLPTHQQLPPASAPRTAEAIRRIVAERR
ncbi:DegT/DnrJ/EryC1/StrS family aminotransferase [Halegenticoccus soli]|uniref:DegT/DnrJ/EryC1/StrS family aminotransferase n=1 Tax=Halegenticoccus soli TaxID=1985678 RepID=UPI000C6ECCC7|nr:DegT/DnrJ/EryC1/StrS family aminotransferase [Halegenticoccus soli]